MCWSVNFKSKNQIFIIIAVLRRSVLRLTSGGFHGRGTAPRQNNSEEETSQRWWVSRRRHWVRLTGPGIESKTSAKITMFLAICQSVARIRKMQTLNVLCQRHGLAVPRAGDRSCATGSIHGCSRSRLTYIPGGCWLEELKLTSQSPSITVEFSVQYNLKIILVIKKKKNNWEKNEKPATM